MTIYTVDEARHALTQSAARLIHSAGDQTSPRRIRRLLTGHGNPHKANSTTRSVIYRHWALLADLHSAGQDWIVDDAIEGIHACIQLEGIRGALSTITAELDQIEHDLAA